MPAAIAETSRLKRVNPLFGSEWDQAIGRHPAATIFHTSRWARVLEESYRYRPFYYLSGTDAPAGLCLFEVNSWLTGRRGVGLPFTDECAPLESESVSFNTLFEAGLEIGAERRWKSVEIRSAPNDEQHPASLSFFTHRLDLRRSPEELFSRCAPAIRRGVRKAEASGLQVTFENSTSALSDYFGLHCLTRQKHGLPPQPLRFFESIHRHIIQPGLGFIALARMASRPIAGAIFFQFRDSALYKFGASDPQQDSLRPNNLLMWQCIRKLAASGAKTLSFGRTSCANDGLRRYKLNWGSVEDTVHYVKWNFGASRCVQDVDRSAGWQNHFFRLCPKTLSRLAGTWLYPHIA